MMDWSSCHSVKLFNHGKKMWQPSVVDSAAALPLIHSVTCQTRWLRSFCRFTAKKKKKEDSQIWCMWKQRKENEALSAARGRALQMVWFYLHAVYRVKLLNLFHTFMGDYSIVVCMRRPFTWLLAWVFQMWCLFSFGFFCVFVSFLPDLTGFKNPSGWNMNLVNHTFHTEKESCHCLGLCSGLYHLLTLNEE